MKSLITMFTSLGMLVGFMGGVIFWANAAEAEVQITSVQSSNAHTTIQCRVNLFSEIVEGHFGYWHDAVGGNWLQQTAHSFVDNDWYHTKVCLMEYIKRTYNGANLFSYSLSPEIVIQINTDDQPETTFDVQSNNRVNLEFGGNFRAETYIEWDEDGPYYISTLSGTSSRDTIDRLQNKSWIDHDNYVAALTEFLSDYSSLSEIDGLTFNPPGEHIPYVVNGG